VETQLFRKVPSGSIRKRRGIALIMVLACVVLLTVMVLAFLVSIGGEVQSSKFYANGSSVKLLAQSATDLVMAEIRDATLNGSYCWASQPGMIRTWDNAGTPKNYYKLYSDVGMVGSGVFDHTAASLVPDGNNGTVAWYNQQGVYVDLNQPVAINGVNQYPIVDGDSGDLSSVTFSTSNSTTPLPTLMLPAPTNTVKVLGAATVATGLPNGFWVNSNTPVQSTTSNQVPMPVRWLYVLKDGSIAVPKTDAAASTTVTFLTTDPVTNYSLPVPSSTNPIVGRMAFWTDDETCKVNVNTASEGTYWDTPRANVYNGAVTAEENLALNSPVQNEFQRYPGHPAMTSLSAVFNLTTPETSTLLITPRVGPGGSQEGTVKTTMGTSVSAITPNSNRLYATTDEYLYQPTLSGSARSLNSAQTGASVLTQTALKQARFFITANSRAPDVNLFNQPRVCIWPISVNNNSAYRTVYDQLIAFCSTMRKDLATPYLYYFQRQDSTDPHTDLPTSPSTSGLGRNRMLMSYLSYLTSQPVPGFGGNFLTKYPNAAGTTTSPTDRDQILTETFDYIRSTNLIDAGLPLASTYTPGVKVGSSYPGQGQVIPIEDKSTTPSTRGFGRFPTVQSGNLLFIAQADDVTNPTGTMTSSGTISVSGTTVIVQPVAAGNVRMQAIFLIQLFDPSVGSIWNNPNFTVQVSGLDSLTWNGIPMGFPANVTLTDKVGFGFNSSFWGDSLGFGQIFPSTASTYALVSSTIDVPKNSTFAFGATATGTATAGDVTIALNTAAGYATNPQTVQTVTLNFPAGTWPTPTVFFNSNSNVNANPGTDTTYATDPTDWQHGLVRNYTSLPAVLNTSAGAYFNMRYFKWDYGSGATGYHGRLGGNFNGASMFVDVPTSPGGTAPVTAPTSNLTQLTVGGTYTSDYGWDVVRSVGSATGDMRLIAAQTTTPTSTSANYPFAPNAQYASSPPVGVIGAHNLVASNEDPYFGAALNTLVQGETIDSTSAVYPSTVTYNGLTTLTTTQGGLAKVCNASNIPINGVAAGLATAYASGNVLGDWDSGVGCIRDGPYINKADDGDLGVVGNGTTTFTASPYTWKQIATNNTMNISSASAAATPALFTPNRLVPSAVTFGSLPTGVIRNKPWQTLLFRPGPINHPGLGASSSLPVAASIGGNDQGPPYTTPPDHLLLDLFTMPVVEPYAISEPLSTAGRINMNYLMVPFTYINRDTGLRAVLKSEQVTSIADSQAVNYKTVNATNPAQTPIRFPVNMDATLSQFYTRRFNNKDIFRSASEICDIDIVPNDSTRPSSGATNQNPVSTTAVPSLASGPTRADMDNYWNSTAAGHRLTGDNLRERIYATLYPRLTTKSNTFTIHFRVQTLKQALPPGSTAAAWTQWREGTDVVTGEYRGAQTIERYVDPNDTSIPDFTASPSTTQSLAPYYKFRVLSLKQFAP